MAHILPDGRRVNHRPQQQSQNYAPPPLQLGARNAVLPENAFGSNGPSALARSLHAAKSGNSSMNSGSPGSTSNSNINSISINRHVDADSSFSFATSPPSDSFLSSSSRTLGAMDVPMPGSLDSNGLSFLARHGPVAASVPAQASNLSSSNLSSSNLSSSNNALRSLYMSAYGIETEATSGSYKPIGSARLAAADEVSSSLNNNNNNNNNLTANLQHAHNSNARAVGSGRRYVSSSFPARASTSIWREQSEDDVFAEHMRDEPVVFEEDFVPSSLTELLTPQERQRRGSSNSRATAFSSQHEAAVDGTTFGEASPGSRLGQLFGSGPIPMSSSASGSTSMNDGLVIGSPLRYSSSVNGELSTSFSSSRTASGRRLSGMVPEEDEDEHHPSVRKLGFVGVGRGNNGSSGSRLVSSSSATSAVEEETQFMMDEEAAEHKLAGLVLSR